MLLFSLDLRMLWEAFPSFHLPPFGVSPRTGSEDTVETWLWGGVELPTPQCRCEFMIPPSCQFSDFLRGCLEAVSFRIKLEIVNGLTEPLGEVIHPRVERLGMGFCGREGRFLSWRTWGFNADLLFFCSTEWRSDAREGKEKSISDDPHSQREPELPAGP